MVFLYIIDLCFLLPIFAAKRGWGFFIVYSNFIITFALVNNIKEVE